MTMPSPVPRAPSSAEPARIRGLATLPVFLPLSGKAAVVAGNSAAVAWKAELLAAAGADVTIWAAEPDSGILALCDRGSESGTLTLQRQAWAPDALASAAVAVCDAETDDEAAAFVEAARQHGVPCNVIDRPIFCQFQFGSIVNRSPVVVGISTAGAAPILGQVIRQKIEALLPPALADWAGLANRLRGTVMARLKAGADRRRFWERLASKAFGQSLPASEESAYAELSTGVMAAGRATLVGAGPGDAEYLTLKAVRALQSADVILFDDLVSEDVLELARREAKRMLVGKRGGRPSCRQDDISDLMIKLARQGKHVVRLKCGDPSIFGRAGEELAALEAAGIPTAVVPGITAASAMAARLGVSLTHRDFAHSVNFVTGHRKPGARLDELDWRALSDPSTTSIFYMSGKNASDIARRAIASARPSSTPVAVMRSISRAEETCWIGTLSDLAHGAMAGDGDGPVLIGIGAVFADAQRRTSHEALLSDGVQRLA